MNYRIIIERIEPDVDTVKIYEQVVENLNIAAVMQAVNKVPRKPRSKGEKKDDK